MDAQADAVPSDHAVAMTAASKHFVHPFQEAARERGAEGPAASEPVGGGSGRVKTAESLEARNWIHRALEKGNRRMVILAMALPSLLQLCGINTIIFYRQVPWGCPPLACEEQFMGQGSCSHPAGSHPPIPFRGSQLVGWEGRADVFLCLLLFVRSTIIFGQAGLASPVIGSIISGSVSFGGCIPAAILSDR